MGAVRAENFALSTHASGIYFRALNQTTKCGTIVEKGLLTDETQI